MAQFDIYRNPGQRSSKRAPYLLEIQGNHTDQLATCVVIPLVLPEFFIPASILNPIITLDGNDYLISTAEITAVSRAILGRSVGNAQQNRCEIIAAVDRLIL